MGTNRRGRKFKEVICVPSENIDNIHAAFFSLKQALDGESSNTRKLSSLVVQYKQPQIIVRRPGLKFQFVL